MTVKELVAKWRGVIKAAMTGTMAYHRCADELEAEIAARSKDRQGNFVERSKVVARQICEHLNVPYDRFGWLPDYLQGVMLAIDEEALAAALATPSPQAPELSRHTCDWCGQDLRGAGFDGHYNIYCHKPQCAAHLSPAQ